MSNSANTDAPRGGFSVRSFFRELSAALLTPLKRYLQRLAAEPQVRFRTVLWAIFVMFVGFFTLVGTNPFRLLIPNAFFHPPVSDARPLVNMAGISVEDQSVIEAPRRLSLEGDAVAVARRVAIAVSRPPGLLEARTGAAFAELEPLPDLALAIRRVWVPGSAEAASGTDTDVKAKDAAHLLIDLRAESLEKEVDRFLLNREADAADRQRLVDGYFRALTQSLFNALPALQRVDFLVAGERRAVRGMRFRLDQRVQRGAPEA